MSNRGGLAAVVIRKSNDLRDGRLLLVILLRLALHAEQLLESETHVDRVLKEMCWWKLTVDACGRSWSSKVVEDACDGSF